MQRRAQSPSTGLRAPLCLVFLFLTACGGAGGADQTQARAILSDADGSVSEWLLQLADGSPPEFLQTQAALVAASPEDVRFRVSYGDAATRDAFLKELRLRGVRAQERVATVRTAGLHYAWLRDLYVAGVEGDGTPLVLMHHPDHLAGIIGAPRHARILQTAKALGAGRILATPLRLEGGSVVSDSERAFLSLKNAVLGVRSGQFPSKQAFLEAAEEYWGRPVTLLSTAWADRAEHLDLLVMPIGDRRAVVSDPALAIRLLHQIPERDVGQFNEQARGVAGRAHKTDGIRYLLKADCLQTLQRETSEPRRLQAFDQIHRELESIGYELTRVPFLSVDHRLTGARVVLSYTNVIQDTRGGKRVVYMPTYRLPTFDDHAARVWERCGFRVVRVDAFGPGLNGGAVRCLSQVIRHPAPPSDARADAAARRR